MAHERLVITQLVTTISWHDAYLQVVEQVDAINHRSIAAHEVECPVGAIAYGDIAHDEVAHPGEREHMGTRIEGGDRFQLVRILKLGPHERHAIATDGSHSGDGDVLGIIGIEPHHSLALVGAESAEMIDALVGIGQECGIGLDMEIDVRLQLDGSGQEGMIGRQEHLSSSFSRAEVDGFLDGAGVIGLAIAYGTILAYIIDLLCHCHECHKQQ